MKKISLPTHPRLWHREVANYFRQLIRYGFWVPIIRPIDCINGVRNEYPLVSERQSKVEDQRPQEMLTFEIPPFARLIINPDIYSQQGLAANPPIHLTVPLP